MRLRYAISAFPLLFLLPLSLEAQTIIHGQTLYGSVNWTSSMNPIVVTGDITIDEGATLTIGPGCDIRFQENSDDTHWGWDVLRSEIIVYGTLNISGTTSDLVILTSTGCKGGGWFGIIFSDNTASGSIQYCNIDRSVYGINFTACRGPECVYGRCTIGAATAVIDSSTNFVTAGAWVGMRVDNRTDNDYGIVTGITTTMNPNDTLQVAGGMFYGNANHAGDYYFFRTQLPSPPTVSNCLINDVSVGMLFDNCSSPSITTSTIINAGIGFECTAASAPAITNCNTAFLMGSKMAVYATEEAQPTFTGCAFSSGSIDLDMHCKVVMLDSTVSGTVNGIIGHETRNVQGNLILSECSMEVDNCNVIGLGDEGEGIVWDDNLHLLEVEYTRLGGFMKNVSPRWGTINADAGILHMIGPRFGSPYYGTCTGGDNTFLIDSAVNFHNIGAYGGMTVYNSTDGSSGTVVAITSIPSTPETFNTLQTSGMSGGETNDAGDIYHFTRFTQFNNVDMGDLGAPDSYRSWPPGHVSSPSVGQNEFYGVQNPDCIFNIEMETSSPIPPSLYQLEVWAEGNWWVTTNNDVVNRYVWDNNENPNLGAVHYETHRTPDEKRTYSVSGTIVDTIGDPIAGVRVAVNISAQFPGHTVLAAITNEYGYYTIYGLLPSAVPYSIVPQKLGYSFIPPSRTVTINASNPSDITGQDFSTVLPAPVITSASRADGADGSDYGLPGRTNWGFDSETTDIIVTGINFRQTPAIFLRGPLPSITDTACSDTGFVTATNLTAIVPASMTIGDYAVRVVNPDGQENIWGSASVPGFTIVRQLAPYVTGIGPNPISSTFSGVLTVSGENFQSGCNLVIGGYTWPGLTPGGEGTSLAVNYDSGTLPPGTYAVIVTNPDEQSSNTDVPLTVNSPPPTITPLPTITPTPGPPTPTPTITPTPGPPTPIPKYPRIQPGTNATIYTWGETLALRVEMWPDSTNAFHNLGDLYIAVRTPNGALLFLSKGRWKRSSAAIYKELVIGVYSSLPLGSFKIGGSFPSGTYTLYGVLNTSGTSVFNPRNWRSGLGSRSFTIR